MTDDRIRYIALSTATEIANQLSEKWDDKIDATNARVVKLAGDMAVIKARLSTAPNVNEEIMKCQKEQALKVRLSFGQWMKIIILILGFVATAFGVNWAAPV
jgi:hypothetical protein